jgi:anaerobic magnesium-protoporphyrin IX monomethyl ester cyclase
VLEKYWNAHRLDHTMKYLIKHEFTSAFDFFQEFGDYWEGRGWQKIGHQLEDLFTRLRAFLLDRGTKHMEIIEGFMKLDYFLGHKYKPRKIWWEFALGKSEQAEYMKLLAEQPERVAGDFSRLRMNEKDMHKHVMIEVLPFQLASYLEQGIIDTSEPVLLVVYFQTDAASRARFYTMPLGQLAAT